MDDLISFMGFCVVLAAFIKLCITGYRLYRTNKLGEWIRGERKWWE